MAEREDKPKAGDEQEAAEVEAHLRPHSLRPHSESDEPEESDEDEPDVQGHIKPHG